MYSELQKKDIAFEIARHGNFNRAARALREDYESFRSIKPSTISRFLKDPSFIALVEAMKLKVLRLNDQNSEASERRKAANIYSKKMGRDEALMEEARNKLEEFIKNPTPHDLMTTVSFWKIFAKWSFKQRAKYAPAIPLNADAALLIESIQEQIIAQFGPRQAVRLIKAIRENYTKRLEAKNGGKATFVPI